MADVQKILLAVELSGLSAEIAPWANLMGRQFNVETHVVHVVPELDQWGVAYSVHPSHLDDRNKIIQQAENKLAEFCQQCLDPALDYRTRVIIGQPAEEVISYIKTEGISLIIIGTHGKSGLDRAIFGSVADRLLRFSPVPVLSVNPYTQDIA